MPTRSSAPAAPTTPINGQANWADAHGLMLARRTSQIAASRAVKPAGTETTA
jgi:hypothetical protein